VSVCREAGHHVKVKIIASTDDYDDLLTEDTEFNPRVVGFSTVSTQYNFVKTMAAQVKKPTITAIGAFS
tara:strand:- start:2067 stop:2273 length:207 start_codon:yes stop_codon:yes gene_type:complete